MSDVVLWRKPKTAGFYGIVTTAEPRGLNMQMSDGVMRFLVSRQIDVELAVRFGWRSHSDSVLAIPYVEDGVVVNEKFRQLPKQKFWQHAGRKKIFWNADVIKDPALAGDYPLLITEGEFDSFAAIQCGYPFSVSVPDGAPPARPGEVEFSGDPDQDGKFSFLWNARKELKKVKRFILATDNDPPGHRLREELMRHLLAARCSVVEYPTDCKDLNDVLMKHGPDKVSDVINNAKPCPVHGLYDWNDYPEEGPLQTYSTGWPLLDQHFMPFLGEFIVITGIPQHGKSQFALQLLAHLARDHGFRSVIFSPEMQIRPMVRDRLLSAFTGQPASHVSREEAERVRGMFKFIGVPPRSDDDYGDFTLEWLLGRAHEAVLRDGIKVLLLDPWNEIEHCRTKSESLPEYIGNAIRLLKRFAQMRKVIVIVVAHPTKLAKARDGTIDVPSLYDISDAAHWFNKSDHGIVIYRDFVAQQTEVHVSKSRFDEAGTPGMVRMKFEWETRRFVPLEAI